MNFCILGSGAWGTAMALHLHRRGHTVTLVARSMEQATRMASIRENKDYLPGFTLPNTLQIGAEVLPSVMEADAVVFASPIKGLEEWALKLKEALPSAWALRRTVVLAKGLEKGSGFLPVEILQKHLPGIPCSVLSGPTNAGEVATGLPAAVVLAAEDQDEFFAELQEAMSGDSLRVYRSNDIRGVGLGGLLKNVYAIAAGISDGLGFGDNAKASLLTRSLQEMVRIGEAMGARPDTMFGLAGAGDLIATAHGKWSRNRALGEAIGKGQSASEYLQSKNTVAEGFETTLALHELCQCRGIETPVLEQVHGVLFKNKPPLEALRNLMSRELKEE